MKLLTSLLLLSFLFFFSRCNNTGSGLSQSSDTMAYPGLAKDSLKLVKTADMRFKVRNVEQTARKVSALAQSFGGMVFDQRLDAPEEDKKEMKVSTDSLLVIYTTTPQANITVRVPSANLETFLYRISDLGYYTGSSNLHIDDRSLAYLENALREKARKDVLALPSSPTNASRMTTLQLKDEAISQQIGNRAIDNEVDYSTVSLSFFQNPVIRREVIANYVLADYDLPFFQRLGQSLKNGWAYFLDFVLVLTHLWVFLLAALLLFLYYRSLQRKGKTVLPTT